jgi:hypothetical protein
MSQRSRIDHNLGRTLEDHATVAKRHEPAEHRDEPARASEILSRAIMAHDALRDFSDPSMKLASWQLWMGRLFTATARPQPASNN